MPVIVVTIPLDLDIDYAALLAAVNGATSQALGLPESAVHSNLVLAVTGSTGSIATIPWPTAILHGGRRDAAQMRLAVDTVTAVLAQRTGRQQDSVWVQWAVNE